jgi:HK97 family phage portal protein
VLGRIRNWFGLETKSTLASPETWLSELFGATPTASNVCVNARTAMTCPAVACAVNAISEACGQLPVHTYQRGDDGAKARATDHPTYALLHDQANDWTPAPAWREQVARDALLHGDHFSFINRVDDRPRELLRLDPERMKVVVDTTSGEPSYKLTEASGERTFDRQNIFHIRAPGFDGYCGVSPVMQARDAIGLAISMEQHASRLFGNGARPSGLISIKGNVGPDALKKAKEAWVAAHSGSKSGGTAVLPGEAQWQGLTFNSVDSQFLQLRAFAISEISRATRVPPILLQDYGRATWSNSAEMGQQFVTYTLAPWLKRIEGEARLKLLSEAERKAGMFVEFLVDDLVKADLPKRMDAYGKAISARILSPNEARAAENRAPYDGGDVFANPNTTRGGTPKASNE